MRRYQPAIAVETMIAPAFSRTGYGGGFAYDTMERAVVAAASIAAHLIERRRSAGLYSTGFDAADHDPVGVLPSGSGQAHLIQIIGLLWRLEAVKEGDLSGTFSRTTVGLGWGSIITGQRVRDILPHVLALRRRGSSIIPVIAEALTDDLAPAHRHGILHIIWSVTHISYGR
ncbi:MAG: hypothetical protein ACUVSY_13555 [Roseiflexus sp.]